MATRIRSQLSGAPSSHGLSLMVSLVLLASLLLALVPLASVAHSSATAVGAEALHSAAAGPSSWSDPGPASSSAVPLDPTTFVPPVPVFPLRFRAKCRFLVGPGPVSEEAAASMSVFDRAAHSMSLRPTLSLVHFDGVSMKVREDFYVLHRRVHRRFFSSVRHFGSEAEWLIYHKQPKSPRACFEIPFSFTISSLFSAPGMPRVKRSFFAELASLGERLEYQGLATLQLLGEGDASPRTDQANVTVLHYKVRNEVAHREQRAPPKGREYGPAAHKARPLLSSPMPPVHVYLHPATHQPLVVSTPHMRLDLLSFQVVSDPQAVEKMQGVFDAQKASKAKCVPFTSQKDTAPKPQKQSEPGKYRDEL